MRGIFVTAVLCAGVCYAQSWELGAGVGYGIYRNARVNAPGAEATAGITNRFVASAVVTENLYDYISGEIRYVYHDGDPFISANGKRANVQGQSHSFTYEMLFHTRPTGAKIRPFAAIGAGAKYYETTGPSPTTQPVPQIADIVSGDQWRVLVSIGGGVKVRLAPHILVRADFRDYITPFPKRLFLPVTGGTDRGLFQQFTPMVGVSYGF